MPARKNYYEILEVSPHASSEVIEKAYRTLMQKYHPDHASSEQKAAYGDKARELNEAHDTLLNPDKRKEYDESRRTSVDSSEYNHVNSVKNSSSHANVSPATDNMVPKDDITKIHTTATSKIGSFATGFVFLYLGVLAFAIIGWIVTTFLH